VQDAGVAELADAHLPTAFKLAEDWYKREIRASVSFGRQHPIEPLTTDPTIAELYRSYVSKTAFTRDEMVVDDVGRSGCVPGGK
jgi:hypothetical protein